MPQFAAAVKLNKIPVLGLRPENNSTAPAATTGSDQGLLWVDTSSGTNSAVLKMWDGDEWKNLLSPDLSNYVTLNGAQTITGTKTFAAGGGIGAVFASPAATSGAAGNSSTLDFQSTYWNGSASVTDTITLQATRATNAAGTGRLEVGGNVIASQLYEGNQRVLTTADTTRLPVSAYSAKGVLVIGTGASTYASQTVGANNTVLVADSAQANGLKWSTIGPASLATPAGGTASISTVYRGDGAWVTAVQQIRANGAVVGTARPNANLATTGALSLATSDDAGNTMTNYTLSWTRPADVMTTDTAQDVTGIKTIKSAGPGSAAFNVSRNTVATSGTTAIGSSTITFSTAFWNGASSVEDSVAVGALRNSAGAGDIFLNVSHEVRAPALRSGGNAVETQNRRGAANGYASLGATTKVPIAELPTGTDASSVVIGNDSRFTNIQYTTQKGTANGYASLDGTTKVPIAQVPTGTTSTTVLLGDTRLNGLTAPNGSVDLNSQKIINLAAPTAATDAARLQDVQAAAAGIDIKPSVRAASTGNVAIASALVNGASLDGVTLATGDRVLLKNQTTATENGSYVVVASGAAGRSTDTITANSFWFVEEGTQADTSWMVTTNGTITLGSTALTFAQFGATTAVSGTANRITVTAGVIDIAGTYVGQTSITTLGTITSGTWNGTDIAVADGGTGASTAAAARTNLGVSQVGFAANLAAITAGTPLSVTHGLNTQDVIAQVRDASTNEYIEVDIINNSTTTVTVTTGISYAANALRIVVIPVA